MHLRVYYFMKFVLYSLLDNKNGLFGCCNAHLPRSVYVTQENSSVNFYKFMAWCLGSLEDKPDPRFVRKAFYRIITNA